MADKILKSWIVGIYNSFNNVISKFSNGLSTMSTSNFTTIKKSDIDTLTNKITEIKNDYYLKNESGLFISYAVSQGQLISVTTKTNYDNEVSGFGVLVCKNIASYSNGTTSCSYGGNNNGYNNQNKHSSYGWGHSSICSKIVNWGEGSGSGYDPNSGWVSCGDNGTCTNAAPCTSNGSAGVILRCSQATITK